MKFLFCEVTEVAAANTATVAVLFTLGVLAVTLSISVKHANLICHTVETFLR